MISRLFASGHGLIVLAAFLWAVEATILKSQSGSINAIGTVIIQYAIVSGLTLLKNRKTATELANLPRKMLIPIAVVAAMGVTAVALFYHSYQFIDLSVASVASRVTVIFVLLFASIFLQENIAKKRLPWILVSLVSAVFVMLPEPQNLSLTGDIATGGALVLTAAALWGACTVISRKHLANGNISPEAFVLGRFGLSSLMLIPFWFVPWGLSESGNPLSVIGLVAGASVLTTIAYWADYAGMKQLPAPIVGLLEDLLPVFVVGLAWVFLGESMTTSQLIATSTLLFSTYQLVKK